MNAADDQPALDEELEKSLREEYSQTWQDMRHRTTVEMTILGAYFATAAGLLYVFTQSALSYLASAAWIFVGVVGLFLSIEALSLLLGERRAWSADISRLSELESVLSHESAFRPRLERVREFDRLWTKSGYSMGFFGSFIWYVIVVVATGAVFGGILGAGLSKLWSLPPEVLAPLCVAIAALLLAIVVHSIIKRTTEAATSRVKSGPPS